MVANSHMFAEVCYLPTGDRRKGTRHKALAESSVRRIESERRRAIGILEAGHGSNQHDGKVGKIMLNFLKKWLGELPAINTRDDAADDAFDKTCSARAEVAEKLKTANERLSAVIAELKKRETHGH